MKLIGSRRTWTPPNDEAVLRDQAQIRVPELVLDAFDSHLALLRGVMPDTGEQGWRV